MRRFVLVRRVDVSGVSGTGLVAEGVEFSDGRAATRWLAPVGRPAQTCVWDRIDDVLAVHGHGGFTELRWVDEARVHADPTPTLAYGQPAIGTDDDPGTPLFEALVHPQPPDPPRAA